MTAHRFGRRAAAALVLTLALGAPAALAHHGWSGYLDDDFVLPAWSRRSSSVNRDILMVHADGGVWDVVLGPPARNRAPGSPMA